ncbi:MAG: aspartate/glutamate racemase family protein [Betaproteobacteria bacterium]|nr:aspartate/glutamate racemase family protein [Betaproteobacteria bacterium]
MPPEPPIHPELRMPPLGILALDTSFPRIPGDVGCAATFAFPVRYQTVPGATVDELVHRGDERLLQPFIEAGRTLAAAGCIGITTTCGFLCRWQQALAAELPVPVLASALLQLPLIERMLPRGSRAGVVTYSAADLTPETLVAAGAKPDTPVAGVAPAGYFARTIREGRATLDRACMNADVVAAARTLVKVHRGIGVIVLECANMPPYRAAVAEAVGLPVFDAVSLIDWFYSALTGLAIQSTPSDLWYNDPVSHGH